MKNKVLQVLISSTFIIGSLLFSQQESKAEFQPHGYRSGHSKSYHKTDIDDWAYMQSRVLEDITISVNQEYALGNYQVAINKAISGLKTLKYNSDRHYKNTLTNKTVKRGLKLYKIMSQKIFKEKRGLRSTAFFLGEYLAFIQYVINEHEVSSNDLGGFYWFGPRQAEEAAVRYVVTMLQMLQRNFYTESNRMGHEYVYPIGSANGVLYASALFINAAANDLEDSIFAYKYSCFIDELFYIQRRIWQHRGQSEAVLNTYFNLKELTSPHSEFCAENPVYGQYSYENEYTTTYTIRETFDFGPKRSAYLDLDRRAYVKKIVLDSYGTRGAAMYEVIVNNDVKGTIYVPGRDPRYFVTIEEMTDNIEFRPLWGSARITQVRVIEREPLRYQPYR